MPISRTLPISLLLLAASCSGAFSPVKEYSGQSFFDGWDFYDGWDEPTFGDVVYLGKSAATQQRLAYTNDAGNAVLRVDDFSTVVWNNKRNSVRLESKDYYGPGTIWIMDAVHMPYGCSVWPSWWTKAKDGWPLTGEIDIVEYVNQMQANQMAIHASEACKAPPNQQELQVGRPLLTNNCTEDAGCTVGETKANSLGAGFAGAGGGVYAAQFDTSGVYIWFWSRPDVPNSIKQATSTSKIDVSDWGRPSAAWPAISCNAAEIFKPQQMIITITLCGKWANADGVFQQTGCQGKCYEDHVVGNGSNYKNAYFEIPYIRAYSPEGQNTIVTPGGSPSSSASQSGSSSTPRPTQGNNGGNGNGASALMVDGLTSRNVIVVMTGLVMLLGLGSFF